jgi:hypothetical protein
MRYSPFFGMIATCLAALSRQSPEARKGRALARGVDGESACQAIMANAIMRHRRNAFIGCVRRQRYQTWRKRPCNPSTTRSARGCHPCLRYDPLPMSPGRAHIGETDCMAGVVGLELRNPLGSKSAGVAGEFPPLWPKWRSRDGSRSSCGVTNVQLRQGFGLVLRARRLTQNDSGACSTCLAGRIRTSVAAKKIIPRRASFWGSTRRSNEACIMARA